MKEMYIKLEWNSCPDSWERRGGGWILGKIPSMGEEWILFGIHSTLTWS